MFNQRDNDKVNEILDEFIDDVDDGNNTLH
jgi:uncharacterized protein YggL (DUF469 family)